MNGIQGHYQFRFFRQFQSFRQLQLSRIIPGLVKHVKLALRPVFLVLAPVLCLPSMGLTENISAADVKVSTPRYKANTDTFSPPIGTYTYEVSWQGIPAATATVVVDREDDKYVVSSHAKTAKFIDIFYRLRYQADGKIDAQDFSPERLVINHKENSRVKLYNITFGDGGMIRSVRQKDDSKEVLEFVSDNYTLDPFSSTFLARSLDWKVGDTRFFDTFNGKSRYLIKLTAVEEITRDNNGMPQQLIVIEPTVRNLTKPAQDSKLRTAKIYVTKDARRDVVEIASSVFVGTVRTELVGFVPKGAKAVTTAANKSTATGKQPL